MNAQGRTNGSPVEAEGVACRRRMVVGDLAADPVGAVADRDSSANPGFFCDAHSLHYSYRSSDRRGDDYRSPEDDHQGDSCPDVPVDSC